MIGAYLGEAPWVRKRPRPSTIWFSDCPKLPVPESAEMYAVISQFGVIRARDFALNPHSRS